MFINTHLENKGWQLCLYIGMKGVQVMMRRRHQDHEDEEPYWYVMHSMRGAKNILKAIKIMYS